MAEINRYMGKELIHVTSGARVAGKHILGMPREFFENLTDRERLAYDQAFAGVGQVALTKEYFEAFSMYGVAISQLLVLSDQFRDPERADDFFEWYAANCDLKAIPIVNNNDPGYGTIPMCLARGSSGFMS